MSLNKTMSIFPKKSTPEWGETDVPQSAPEQGTPVLSSISEYKKLALAATVLASTIAISCGRTDISTIEEEQPTPSVTNEPDHEQENSPVVEGHDEDEEQQGNPPSNPVSPDGINEPSLPDSPDLPFDWPPEDPNEIYERACRSIDEDSVPFRIEDVGVTMCVPAQSLFGQLLLDGSVLVVGDQIIVENAVNEDERVHIVIGNTQTADMQILRENYTDVEAMYSYGLALAQSTIAFNSQIQEEEEDDDDNDDNDNTELFFPADPCRIITENSDINNIPGLFPYQSCETIETVGGHIAIHISGGSFCTDTPSATYVNQGQLHSEQCIDMQPDVEIFAALGANDDEDGEPLAIVMSSNRLGRTQDENFYIFFSQSFTDERIEQVLEGN